MCQSAVHTQKPLSYWTLSVSMATSVLQLCSVETVLPVLLRLSRESRRCRKKKICSLQETPYILTTGHLHWQRNSWISLTASYFVFPFKDSHEMRKTVIKSNRLKAMSSYLRGRLGSYQFYKVIEVILERRHFCSSIWKKLHFFSTKLSAACQSLSVADLTVTKAIVEMSHVYVLVSGKHSLVESTQ